MTFGAVALNAVRGAGERSLHPASGQAAAVPGPTYCQTNKLSFKSAADRGTWRTLGRRRGRARSFRGMSPSRAPARHYAIAFSCSVDEKIFQSILAVH